MAKKQLVQKMHQIRQRIDLRTMTLQELKAFQYDQIVKMEAMNEGVRVVHAEIQQRLQQEQVNQNMADTKSEKDEAKGPKKD